MRKSRATTKVQKRKVERRLALSSVNTPTLTAAISRLEAPITPGIARSSRPPVHAPAGEPDIGPQISFTRSGLTIPWDSLFSSLLELAEACDVPVKWSCRTGVCDTCECALIGGTVHYEPDPLEGVVRQPELSFTRFADSDHLRDQTCVVHNQLVSAHPTPSRLREPWANSSNAV